MKKAKAFFCVLLLLLGIGLAAVNYFTVRDKTLQITAGLILVGTAFLVRRGREEAALAIGLIGGFMLIGAVIAI